MLPAVSTARTERCRAAVPSLSRSCTARPFPAESSPVKTLADLTKRMTAGMAVLLLDGCAKGIAFSVQGLKFRSVEEPSGEGNLRGSREGFTDLLRVNLSLLRRLIRTEHLVQEVAQATVKCKRSTPFATARRQTPPW